ncbi:MAG: protein translocase subunit SecF [Alphaproteobacteria bacterium]
MGLRLIRDNTKVDFYKYRYVNYAISVGLILLCVGFFFARDMNYGIDFKGGILIESRLKQAPNLAELRKNMEALNLGEITLTTVGKDTDILLRVAQQPGGEKAQAEAVERIKKVLGEGTEYRRVESVGPKVGAELVRDGIIAVSLALVGIMFYVWLRFEWQFAVAGIIATAHDTILTVGLYAVFGLEFNLTTIAAAMTIAGYSINDTVVVFDRMRENLRKYKRMDLPQLMNLSINETLPRTIATSVTTGLAALALFLFGGPVIHDFSLAILLGIIWGTYSSICVAAPLVLLLGISREAMQRVKKDDEAETPEKEPTPPATPTTPAVRKG